MVSDAEARAREAVPRDLEGRVALVLGAGSIGPGWGIGKAIACRYAAAGALVVAADRERGAADGAAAEIAALGGRVEVEAVDVLDDAALVDLVRAVEARHGRLDLLHCNVGLGKAGPGAETSAAEFRRFAEANLTSVHVAAQAALPGMRARGAGVILATSTVASLREPGYPHLAYGATKAGLNHLIRLIAVEEAPHGIRANLVVPGLIDTPRIARTLAGAYGEEMRARRAAQVPMGRMGEAFDVADAALFLASDRARYVTGAELVVDGGLTATVRGG
ncbi:MAG TPA: SDR family NAD(P)-dependent oxidoreductase [Paracoccaceae bacterium]|nr:SDR family NAD(P)-dependent oxidoreductase [Paracoccaceae bacterium]